MAVAPAWSFTQLAHTPKNSLAKSCGSYSRSQHRFSGKNLAVPRRRRRPRTTFKPVPVWLDARSSGRIIAPVRLVHSPRKLDNLGMVWNRTRGGVVEMMGAEHTPKRSDRNWTDGDWGMPFALVSRADRRVRHRHPPGMGGTRRDRSWESRTWGFGEHNSLQQTKYLKRDAVI